MGTVYSTIRYDGDHPPVARITLDRPDKRNPIGPVTNGELIHAFTAAREDPAIRVIVLTGAGDVFSAGGDLSVMAGGGDERSPVKPASLVALLTFMHELGKPIIAMVNGHALAGGMGLMLACDLVVASDAARFGTTEIKVGLWPMMITAEIIRNIGRKKALELMLLGEPIGAVEAERIGLINRVVPAAQLEAETARIAAALADRSPIVLSMGIKAFYETQDSTYLEALEYLETELGRVLALDDAREGLMAFFQKRKPVWKGR
jgi:enoyl-CoA hydratase/carnithine racemase